MQAFMPGRLPSVISSSSERRRAPGASLLPALGCAFAALLTGGCGWVDSTGRQASDGPPSVVVLLDQVAPGEAVVLNEQSAARLPLNRVVQAGDEFFWSESPLEQGALDTCASVPGFRPELAAATLAEACSVDAESCAFEFVRDPPISDEPQNEPDAENAEDPTTPMTPDGSPEGSPDGSPEGSPDVPTEVGFVVAAPTLRASIGLRHELTVVTADGASGSETYDFCLIAINEAPFATDDGPYVVTEGSTLVIGADGDNLLSNDGDDDDAGNDGLQIDTTPVRAPSASDAFELRADGGFSYSFPDLGIRGSIADSFEYVVTDGEFTSEPATVRLTIVPSNLPPILALALEPLEVEVGERVEFNLAGGFTDPEGEALVFTVNDDETLPLSGSLVLGEDGVLVGQPLPEDVGDYDIRFVASDGVRETEARLSLSIIEPPNAAPQYVRGSITDIVLLRARTMVPRTPEFTDPEDEVLSYALIGELPLGLLFDEDTGTLSGRPLRVGLFTGLQIVATDPEGASARSAVFLIQVVGQLDE